jgi:anti-anti-sigma regulatory factor
MERSLQGAVHVIQCEERLADETVESLNETLDECLADSFPMAVLSLERTQVYTGVGLECLLDAHDRFTRRGGGLKLAAPSELGREILSITEIDRRIDVYRDVPSAVRSFVQ